VGVVCEHLAAKLKGKTLNITGKFGVFYEGSLKISTIDKKGNPIKVLTSAIKVSPLESFDLNLNIDNLTDLSEVEVVSISLLDKDGKLMGELADAVITRK
jgi:hypothetical protein